MDSVGQTSTLTHFKKPSPPKNRRKAKKGFLNASSTTDKVDGVVYASNTKSFSNKENSVDLDSISLTPTLAHFKKPKPPKNRRVNKRWASETSVADFKQVLDMHSRALSNSGNIYSNIDLDSVGQTPTLTHFKKPCPPKNRRVGRRYLSESSVSDIKYVLEDINSKHAANSAAENTQNKKDKEESIDELPKNKLSSTKELPNKGNICNKLEHIFQTKKSGPTKSYISNKPTNTTEQITKEFDDTNRLNNIFVTKKSEITAHSDKIPINVDLDSVSTTPRLSHFKKPSPPKHRRRMNKRCYSESSVADIKQELEEMNSSAAHFPNIDEVDSIDELPTNRLSSIKLDQTFQVKNAGTTNNLDNILISHDLDSVGLTTTLTHFKKPKPPMNRKRSNKRWASESSMDAV